MANRSPARQAEFLVKRPLQLGDAYATTVAYTGMPQARWPASRHPLLLYTFAPGLRDASTRGGRADGRDQTAKSQRSPSWLVNASDLDAARFSIILMSSLSVSAREGMRFYEA